MKLTAKRLRERMDYNQETGVFTRRETVRGRRDVGNYSEKGYIRICVDGSLYRAHRLAWLYVYGEHPDGEIDHINGKKDDNRICNLRIADRSLNQHNIHKAPKNSKSGYRGVFFEKQTGRWKANIRYNKKCYYLGHFDNPIDGHREYVKAKNIILSGGVLP